MKKYLVGLVLLVSLVIPPLAFASTIELPAKAGMAVEVRTGKILYEKNADQKVPVGNLSRLLTLYLVYDAVKAKRINWDDKVTINDYALQLTQEPDIPNVTFTHPQYSVKDLTKASLISASSSASVALAEHVAGSEQEAVEEMRRLLDNWGIKKHSLVNASGVNNRYLGDYRLENSPEDAENQLSARDLAIISYRLINDFPEVLELSEATQGNFGGEPIPTYNYLLENMPYARLDTYGLITGTSTDAGSGLISLSYENRMQVLSIFLDVDGGREDSDKRFLVAHDFLNQIAEQFHLQKVLPASTSYKDTPAPVLDGVVDKVSAVTQDDFYVVTTPDTVDNVQLKAVFPDKTNYAPIKEGQVVGQVVFDDKKLVGKGYLADLPSMSLIAENEVARTNLLKIIWNHFVQYIIDNL
ncbi:serine hydrolase [Streptococcus entericus]|uniref:serine hydrolase n=1 Tax=Streptococcus entericus TaxID=155680 RepID=UPI00037CE384|nr:serine hydrolase [Streptococcus entericus]